MTTPVMGTIVTLDIHDAGHDEWPHFIRHDPFEWFHRVEACASRFSPSSELSSLVAQPGQRVPVSDMLFEMLRVACTIAEASNGAFDPTIGASMHALGFNREYASNRPAPAPPEGAADPSYRDVVLDDEGRVVTLVRPVALDLGAIAKGFAIDLTVRALAGVESFAIDAGGDLYLGGTAAGRPWTVGIRHPRDPSGLVATLAVSNAAVCTSGDYERRSETSDAAHHVLDPRDGRSASRSISATVVAPSAMLADGLSTAAFVLGPVEGIALLEEHGVEGLIVTPELGRVETRGFRDVVLSYT